MLPVSRPAAVAGMFYPADARALAHEVDALLGAVPRGASAHAPKIVVVPHAGYVYSGAVAAQAYALLAPWRGRIRRVVLLGPTHRVAVRGLAVPSASAFETPLGRVPLDVEALARLKALPQVVASDEAHALEHAIEVQLPFLQRVLAPASFALVPLAVGRASAAEVQQVLEAVWGGDETLIVSSTDLSHYLPYDEARRVDRATVGAILRLDARLDHEQACGATPLAGALYYHFANKDELLVAVYAEGVRRIGGAAAAAIARHDEPWDRLEAACAAHLESLLEGSAYAKVVIAVRPDGVPSVAARLVALRDSYERLFVALIDALPLPPRTPRAPLRMLLLGALNWTPTWYRAGGLTPQRIARSYVQLLGRPTRS